MASGNKAQSWVLPVGVVAIAVALVSIALTGPQTPNEPTAPVTASPEAGEPAEQAAPEVSTNFNPEVAAQVESRDSGDPLAAGPIDAPVGLVVFSDYQCGYCGKWSAETLPAMLQLADEGRLRIEWRDINVFGPVSERASRASYAAGLQGKFWEYHAALFPNGGTLSELELTEDSLIALAAELGLDTAQFTADLNSDQTAQTIAENQTLGLSLGATSTPTFLLAGQPIVGAMPKETFTETFAAAEAAATAGS